MKRRDALKRLGLASGAIVATPAVLSMLNSCTSAPEVWTPQFLTVPQGKILKGLVDVFLPETPELPSAKALNVPEFIDQYIAEVYDDKDQKRFTEAFEITMSELKSFTKKELKDVEKEDLKVFLDEYLKVKGEVDTDRENYPDFDGMTTSECLDSLKWMTVNAYLNSERIGEEVLAYDPVPGAYYCGDLNELTEGKRWSLS
jgi:predicted XRE-type DNA-binding protein